MIPKVSPDGETVTGIGEVAFFNCTDVTSVTIPDSVTSIGDSAFSRCTGLTSIIFEGTTEQWNSVSLGKDWGSDIPATEAACSDGTVSLK